MSGCLAGIRVIDMPSVLMGPYATQLLGDMGADVIKVEPPAGERYAYAAEHFARRDTATWLRLLDEADIPAMRVHTVESLRDDPHLRATGSLRDAEHPTEGPIREIGPPGRWTDSPLSIRRPAPGLGQHTEEVLREAGFTEDDLAGLLDARAAFTSERSGRDAR